MVSRYGNDKLEPIKNTWKSFEYKRRKQEHASVLKHVKLIPECYLHNLHMKPFHLSENRGTFDKKRNFFTFQIV